MVEGENLVTWRLAHFSLVVVGESHNPTILNPDFLVHEGIVPKPWKWNVEETITTPPLALVRYTNSVHITVEQRKFQITDSKCESGPGKSRISEIAVGYVRILPHVKYTAVGCNFHALLPVANPGRYLRERFLKPGPWNSYAAGLGTVGIKLSYEIDETLRMTLTIDAGEAQTSEGESPQEVVIIGVNFNRECKCPSVEDAVECLQQVPRDWGTFNEAMERFFGKGSQ